MTQTALTPSVNPVVALTLVTCATCGNIIPVAQAVRFEYIEALDGDETNLTVSNIRFTGDTGYDCSACIDAYCATLE
jgi:hypothetical protein